MLQADRLRSLIDSLRQEWNVPGVALAVVNNHEVLFAEGFGLRNIENKLPVTPHSLFAIGSVTKAFVATGAAMLVDEGKLEWDKPVREYLPWFKLQDTFASERITMRDLLTHRSGLPRHEKMWWKSNASRYELIRRLRYLQPSADLRATFQYQNIMYVTAGYLIGEVAGMSWEDFTQQRILDPLGMNESNFSAEVTQTTADFAYPYIARDGGIHALTFYHNDETAPAGAINSNLVDLAKWVQFQLNGGKVDGKQLVSEKALAEIHKAQMLIDDPATAKYTGEEFLAYGLGWFIAPYRGRKMLRHSGGIDGFVTQCAFVPAENLGVILYANLNETYMPGIALRAVFDHVLGVDDIDWNARVKTLVTEEDSGLDKSRHASEAQRVPNTQPSHPLNDFVGEYEHPGYGVMRIERAGDGLRVVLHSVPSPLTHYHYDIFELYNEMYEDNKWIKLVFETGIDGKISGLSAKMELATEPIHFTRVK